MSGGAEWDALCAGLPRDALSVVSEILSGAEDPAAREASRRISARAGFVLSAESPDGARMLFSGLPQFRQEVRRRDPPNPALYTSVSPQDVASWFEPGGRFSEAIDGYESRPEQTRMAVAVTEAFDGCRHAVIEAGTGVGKTFAYLVPAVMWSVANRIPVVVSTNTKNLQEQLFRKDLPVVAKLLRAPVKFALVKGRGNYLCLSRLQQLVEKREAELVRGELPALARAVAWAFFTAEGDLSEFDPGPRPPDASRFFRFSDRIASNADDCRGRKCPYWSRCFVQHARDAALSADVVVTNHAVFFSEPDDKPLALPKAAQVVFDEAHNLEEAATAHFEREIGPRSLKRTLSRLYAAGKRGGKTLGTGLLPDIERFLLSGPVMSTPEAREALLEIVASARKSVESVSRSGAAWFRALGGLVRGDERAKRLRPTTLESPAWRECEPALARFQDALYALSTAVSLLHKVFSPRVDSQGVPVPAPRYRKESQFHVEQSPAAVPSGTAAARSGKAAASSGSPVFHVEQFAAAAPSGTAAALSSPAVFHVEQSPAATPSGTAAAPLSDSAMFHVEQSAAAPSGTGAARSGSPVFHVEQSRAGAGNAGGKSEDGVLLELSPAVLAAGADGGRQGGDDAGRGQGGAASVLADIARRLETSEGSLIETVSDVEFLSSASDEDWAYWAFPEFSAGRKMPEAGIRAAPVEISKFLADWLFAKRDSVILCSATMSACGKTEFLSKRLGMDLVANDDPGRISELKLGSPFDYARQCLAAVPSFVPEVFGPDGGGDSPDSPFSAAFGDLAARLAVAARGGTMVLFTSYRSMCAVAARVKPVLDSAGIALLVQGSGPSREELTARFRDVSSPSVLFGTDSFWEGVDLVGDALRCLIIAKIPFPSPGDPLVEARCDRVAANGGSSFRDFSLPSASIKLRQGFGRLIRNKTDTGIVVIADGRLFSKGYGAVLRRDLPAEVVRYSDPDALVSDAKRFFGRSV
ncbi:MAG: hypothetical protein IJ678_04045 [Kiritimatiellae bacterium]|nr:hypothetical protein [Kiritimatiellia bacterium]